MTAIFLSCSAASIVTKFALGKSNFVISNSFLASLIGMIIMFLPSMLFVPGPNIG